MAKKGEHSKEKSVDMPMVLHTGINFTPEGGKEVRIEAGPCDGADIPEVFRAELIASGKLSDAEKPSNVKRVRALVEIEHENVKLSAGGFFTLPNRIADKLIEAGQAEEA